MMTILAPDDLLLLRRFEPILYFNKAEQFYPMNVDRYVAGAKLSARRPNQSAKTLVPRGQLDTERLAKPPQDVPGAVYYLSVAEPLTAAQVRTFYRSSTLREFHAGSGRLAQVGLLSRLVDVLFTVSLLLRGKVPGGLAFGAARHYQALQARDERYCYYGRVAREHGYIALQYWFFYAFNDWRSSFHGVNDHESDWEMITIYAAQDEHGTVQPCWLAYSSHESEGDDLRRRWDDPAIERSGDHPIVYVGAGSHANYYFSGEYLLTVAVAGTEGFGRLQFGVQRLWARLGQGVEPDPLRESGGFRIPYVDYARGDGRRIGPGQERTWEMRVLQATTDAPEPSWVDGYRGLWGLYTGDPAAGEDAPPGPKYDRRGMLRERWYDPIGWSGLDKVPPPGMAVAALEEQQQRLRAKQEDLTRQIAGQVSLLTGLEMEAAAIRNLSTRGARGAGLQRHIQEVSAKLDDLKAQRAAHELGLANCVSYASELAEGNRGDPRAHLRRPPLPIDRADLRMGRLAAIWSAISIGVLMLALAVLAQFSNYLAPGVLVLVGVYAFIEALFRRNLQTLMSRVVVGLALVTVLVLAIQFFALVTLALVVLFGLLIIVENVREVLT